MPSSWDALMSPEPGTLGRIRFLSYASFGRAGDPGTEEGEEAEQGTRQRHRPFLEVRYSGPTCQ